MMDTANQIPSSDLDSENLVNVSKTLTKKDIVPLSDGEISSKKILCPSAHATEGAILLGVRQSDGTVLFIKDRISVTKEFLDIASKGDEPETRFRFSCPCIGKGCKQWVDGGCSLPDRLINMISSSDSVNEPLPDCSIRAECRWFNQRGYEACRICPIIIRRDASNKPKAT